MSWSPMVALGLVIAEGVASQGPGTALLGALDERYERDGKHPAAVGIWVNWGDLGWAESPRWTFPDPVLLEGLDQRGIVPLITWQPVYAEQPGDSFGVPFRDILEGMWDGYLDAFAQGAAAYGKRVIVRFAHEGNGNWFPWSIGQNGNTPWSARRAHRYVHDRVRAIAPNVDFWWCPNAVSDRTWPLDELYPGDDYVEVVGFDSYNWSGIGGRMPMDAWRATIAELKALTGSTKPIIVGETGVKATGDPEDAAFRRTWLRDGFREAQATWRILQAIVYFDYDMTEVNGQPDWRMSATPCIAGSWRGLLMDPDFAGTLR
jgi:mannan endo-1,4-beta-mannosidase